MQNLSLIKSRITQYKDILKNTEEYREAWHDHLKEMILSQLNTVLEETDLDAEVTVVDEYINLESIVFDLGVRSSGIEQIINTHTTKRFVKSNGSLVYQQLFNGKILIYITYPFIEGMSQAKSPKNIEILRPEEMKDSFVLRHVELLLKEVTEWEDYDDDLPQQQIGFNANFIGTTAEVEENE